MTTDIRLEEILAIYGLRQFGHPIMLAITGIPNRRLQVWYQRGHLHMLGMTAHGRGHHRTYSLADLLFLSYMQRLTCLSVPVAEASRIASVFLPRGGRIRSDCSVGPEDINIISLAVEAWQSNDVGPYALVYRSAKGDWISVLAPGGEVDKLGTLEDGVIITDLGAMTRLVIKAAIRLSGTSAPR